MGRDKATLPIDGTTLLQRTAALVGMVVADVAVAVRPDRPVDAARAAFPLLKDPGHGLGPGGGLRAAHAADPAAAWLVVACDLPGLDVSLLRSLAAGRDPAMAGTAYPRVDGRGPEPLCAIYEPATLSRLQRQPDLSPSDLLATNIRLLPAPPAASLMSANTPGEWQLLTGSNPMAKKKVTPNSGSARKAVGHSRGVQPSREQAEAAVRTLLAYIGEDPDRAGLRKTPGRFVGAYEDWFNGYRADPAALLGSSFAHVDRYERMVALTNVHFESHCEHHVAPVIGRVHLAYLPAKRLAGISKLVRVVELFTRRLIVQEKLTAELAACIESVLQPRGVAVVVEAQHHCLTTRGVHRDQVRMTTSELLGDFHTDKGGVRTEFLAMIQAAARG
jgi:GTP cyclohydrolase IA